MRLKIITSPATGLINTGFIRDEVMLTEKAQEFLCTYHKDAYLFTIAFLFISFQKLSYGQEKIFSPLGKNFSMLKEKSFYAYRAKFSKPSDLLHIYATFFRSR